MKVLICSRVNATQLKDVLRKHGFSIVSKNPDFILSYGGDGTALYAERKYPSVPKLLIKKTKVCRKCDLTFIDLEDALQKFINNKYTIKEEMKLKASYKNQKLMALNEVQIHNKDPARAVRFSVKVNGKEFDYLIGDGVIVATPFGSTAYYQSTGGNPFKKGIGVSFNNLYGRKVKSFTVPEKSKIKIKILRGPALLIVDNCEKSINLKEGDIVNIQKSDQTAKFIQII